MLSNLLKRVALVSPRRVAKNLERVRSAGLLAHTPNEWQVTLGVLRMWHRVLFRSDTIGTCTDHPVRNTWRAKMLLHRPVRFPFLIYERAVAPWDFSGLFSKPDRITRHLLAAHHDGDQFVYDLQMLSCYPHAIERLHEKAKAVVEHDDRHTRWLRDLVVYDRYHENLLETVERFRAGEDTLSAAAQSDPDISFLGYLSWCAAQPETPAETWRSLARGDMTLSSAPTAAP